MTIKECIDIVDDLKPNQYSIPVKVMWLSFIDEIIINDVLKTHEGYDGRYDDFTGYSEDKLSVPLIVESPYDRLYTAYLKMKIDAENGETARYNNSAGLFNSYMMEYRKYYNKTHMPLSKSDREKSNCKATKLDVTEAQLEFLKRELYPILAEDISKAVSDDKIYDIVMNYVNNNIKLLTGAIAKDVNSALEVIANMKTTEGTVVSHNADFAEVAEWGDGNPTNEDRTGYFVCADVPVNGIVMKKATSVDDVKGVTILSPAFAGNYSEDKVDSNGNLLPKYSYVAILGFVPVIDNGTCTVGGRCMPDNNGCAVPSSNSMGYQVVNRIDEKRVLIIIEPNGDMVQRIKARISNMQEDFSNFKQNLKTINGLSLIGPGNIYFSEQGILPIDISYNPESENALSGKAIAEALSTKVDSEKGKGLSTNDYDNAEKAKVASALQPTDIDQTYSPESIKPQSGKAVSEAVANLVNSAPETLDTLNELAKALGDDPNFAASVARDLGNKVDKETGKGLSTNDFTTEEKTKLANIEENATSVGKKTTNDGEVFNDYENNVASEKYAHAEGANTQALGYATHSEGNGTVASSSNSHAEGKDTNAKGYASHAEGEGTIASARATHAEGTRTTAYLDHAHAEGFETHAENYASHAEGKLTHATGKYSHAEGCSTFANGENSHAEGKETTAESENSHAEGYSTHAQNSAAHAEGYNTCATGENSHAEGTNTLAQGKNSHAEGNGTTAGGGKHTDVNEGVKDSTASHAEGIGTMAYGQGSHAEGRGTITGEFDEDGNYIVDSGAYCHAEGEETKAIGRCSHAEGNFTEAKGSSSHAEGIACKSIGHNSHAEGDHTEAGGNYSHAEGRYTEARGFGSHAEGEFAVASGFASHAEGGKTVANGWGSHAEGYKTRIDTTYGHVQGCNNSDYTADEANGFLHVVGNGYVDADGNTIKGDAHTLNKAGYGCFSGGVGGPLADYAEFFEWQDGNPEAEDRIGLIVTLDSDKIKLAKSGDEVLGIVSGTALVIGDDYETSWSKKFLTDDFGRIVYKEIEQFVEILKDDGTSEKKSIGFEKCPVVNPEYDPEQVYINRHDRQEWDVIGMLGKLYVRDDGTAQVNGYVTVGSNGIATTTLTKTNMRVLSRVNDNVIRVLLK